MKNLCITLALLFLPCTLLFAQKEIRQTIYFDFGSSELNKSELQKLDSLVIALKPYKNYEIALTGHTDSIGDTGDNYLLSNDRSNTVLYYLANQDIAQDKMTRQNYGEDYPADFAKTPEARARNRRVEILVTFPSNESFLLVEVNPAIAEGPAKKPGGNNGGEPQTIKLPPGPSSAGGYGLNVITNTNQMEALGLTTQTTDGEPLVSNVMICITSTPTDTNKFAPVTVLVPASFNPYCKVPDVILYDSKADTTDENQIKWMPLLFPDMKPVVVDGVEYFEWTIGPGARVGNCKNADCPKRNAGEVTIKLKSNKYEMVSLSAVYPKENALLRGHAIEKNNWQVKTFSNDSINSPHIKVVVKDKNGQLHTTDVLLRDMKKNRKGEYILKKKMFAKRES